jgi:TRAP-type C4-dicarboxylate transport system permease small subunit
MGQTTPGGPTTPAHAGLIGRLHTVARAGFRVLDLGSRGARGLAETLGLIGLGFGIALQLVDLVMRNVGLTSSVPNWLDDGSTLALVNGAFIYWAATDRHIGFGGLVGYIPSLRVQVAIHRIAELIVVSMLVLLTVEGIGLVQSQAALGGSYSSAFDFPLWLFYAVAPFTFAISALRQLRRALGPEVELVAETTDGGEA